MCAIHCWYTQWWISWVQSWWWCRVPQSPAKKGDRRQYVARDTIGGNHSTCWAGTPHRIIAYHIKTHTQCQTANTVSNTVVPHATVGDIQQGLSKAPSSSSLSPSPVRSNAGFDAPSSSGLSHKGRHFLRPLIVFAWNGQKGNCRVLSGRNFRLLLAFPSPWDMWPNKRDL